MNILENDKIKLRATEPEDIDFIYELENNSNFWDIADTNEPFSKYIIKAAIFGFARNSVTGSRKPVDVSRSSSAQRIIPAPSRRLHCC